MLGNQLCQPKGDLIANFALWISEHGQCARGGKKMLFPEYIAKIL